jgi:hypothetical protein
MADDVPLATLLSWAWITLAMEIDNAAEAEAKRRRFRRRFQISLAMWANGLRLIDEDGVTVGDLAARAGTGCNIAGLERWGWISIDGTENDRRPGYGSRRGVNEASVLRPTHGGVAARALWPAMVEDVEQRWRDRFGPDTIEGLTVALADRGKGTPWAPPEVHSSDGFRVHAVATTDGDPVTLVGRLGQALTALTVEHEEGSAVSAALGANALRVIGGTGAVLVRDLTRLSGISKEAMTMATGFTTRHHLAEIATDRSIRLTAKGRAALEDYRSRAARPVDDDLRSRLAAILSRRETLASGLAPPEGGWRNEKPYVAQTRRILDDPTAALPWQPMVLHRGGWPDGS